jgi:hypothetical protein
VLASAGANWDDGFFRDFNIEISIRFVAASRRTTKAPPRPTGRQGRISGGALNAPD